METPPAGSTGLKVSFSSLLPLVLFDFPVPVSVLFSSSVLVPVRGLAVLRLWVFAAPLLVGVGLADPFGADVEAGVSFAAVNKSQ